jgi:excisionase family DNA binding protein
MSQTAMSDVLTLEEAASYLKLPLETIEREASRGHIPGRRIEDTWRFLKSAIDDWLRAQDSRDILLQQAGALKDDPYLDELLATIYRERKEFEAGDANRRAVERSSGLLNDRTILIRRDRH